MHQEIMSPMFQEILPALSMLIHHSDINILVDTVSRKISWIVASRMVVFRFGHFLT